MPPKHFRITDNYVRRRILAISKRRGDSSPTRTATALLIEMLPLIDDSGDFILTKAARVASRLKPQAHAQAAPG